MCAGEVNEDYELNTVYKSTFGKMTNDPGGKLNAW
jgi:hypothetical protein